jgi:AAA domain
MDLLGAARARADLLGPADVRALLGGRFMEKLSGCERAARREMFDSGRGRGRGRGGRGGNGGGPPGRAWRNAVAHPWQWDTVERLQGRQPAAQGHGQGPSQQKQQQQQGDQQQPAAGASGMWVFSRGPHMGLVPFVAMFPTGLPWAPRLNQDAPPSATPRGSEPGFYCVLCSRGPLDGDPAIRAHAAEPSHNLALASHIAVDPPFAAEIRPALEPGQAVPSNNARKRGQPDGRREPAGAQSSSSAGSSEPPPKRSRAADPDSWEGRLRQHLRKTLDMILDLTSETREQAPSKIHEAGGAVPKVKSSEKMSEAAQYRKFWRELIREEIREEIAETEAELLDDQRSRGLRRLSVESTREDMASFELILQLRSAVVIDKNSSSSVRGGDMVLLSPEADTAGSKPVFLDCSVVRASGTSIILAASMGESTTAVQRHGTAGKWRVDKFCNITSVNRMLKAIDYASSLDDQVMSPLLQSVLISQREVNPSDNPSVFDKPPDAETKAQEDRIIQQLNDSQARAVQRALDQTMTLIHGPPGTGKTTTALALIRCVVARLKSTGRRDCLPILLTGESNTAVDTVVSGFVQASGEFPDLKVARVGRAEKIQEDVESEFSIDVLLAKHRRFPELENIRRVLQNNAQKWTHKELAAHEGKARQLETELMLEILSRCDVVCSTLAGCG